MGSRRRPAGTGLPYPATSSILAASDTVIANTGNFCGAGVGTPTYQIASTLTTPVTAQPSFGLTDLEASAFVGFNNPLAPAALPVVGAHTGIYDLVFGIAVTPNVFAQKTSFSYSEVAGILSGNITTWNQLKGDSGAPLTLSGYITLLDRNVGSGHKTSSSTEFLGYPQLGSAATTPTSVANGYYGGTGVAQNGTPPAVCGTGYQDIQETSAAGTVADLKTLANCGTAAVAILSMDNPPGIAANQNTSGVNAYDFVALNGVFVDTNTSGDSENGASGTSYVNVLKGNYTWYYQANFNTQAGFLGSAGTNSAADLAATYLGQLGSKSLPGCTGSPGLAFPGNLPGTVVDGDQVSTLGTCVTNSSRKGNSDRPLAVTLDGGSITLGKEPL